MIHYQGVVRMVSAVQRDVHSCGRSPVFSRPYVGNQKFLNSRYRPPCLFGRGYKYPIPQHFLWCTFFCHKVRIPFSFPFFKLFYNVSFLISSFPFPVFYISIRCYTSRTWFYTSCCVCFWHWRKQILLLSVIGNNFNICQTLFSLALNWISKNVPTMWLSMSILSSPNKTI